MDTNKSILAVAMLSLMTACGGSGGSSSSTNSNTPTPTPDPVETTVIGQALHLANANLKAYKFEGDEAVELTSDDIKEAEITTDENGNYSFTLVDFSGAIKVELSVGENTKLLCDSPSNCGAVAFGEAVDLSSEEPDFKLSSISSISSDSASEVVINTTTLTHLASKLIENVIATSEVEDVIIVQEQSSIVANAFKIQGNITELAATSLIDHAAVISEDNVSELKYGLINTGVLSALYGSNSPEGNPIHTNNIFAQGDAVSDLTVKLEQAANDLVEFNGSFAIEQDEDSDFELSLVDVLSGASRSAALTADVITDNDEVTQLLKQLDTSMVNQAVYEQVTANDQGRNDPAITIITAGDAVAKAQSMVEDVRLFANLFDVSKNEDVVAQGDAYLALVDEAGVMIEAEADSFLLLANISDALANIATGISDGNGTVNAADYIQGATGAISFSERTDTGGMAFSLSVMKGNETVELNVEASFTDEGTSITLAIEGKIESAGATFTLSEGSHAKVNFNDFISRDAIEDDSFNGEITSGELDLTVSLAQKQTDTVTNPVSFEGVIKTKLFAVTTNTLGSNWKFARGVDGRVLRDENGNIYDAEQFDKGRGEKILPEMLTLSGALGSHEGDLVKATLTVNIKDLDSYEAPEFQYIGASVAGIYTVTVSEDKNTVSYAASSQVLNEHTDATTVFTPGEVAGEWQLAFSSFGSEDYTDFLTRTIVPFGDMIGYQYTTASRYSAYVELVRPNDYDNDQVVDDYTYLLIFGESIDDNGSLLGSNGDIIELTDENAWGVVTYDELQTLFKAHALQPNTVTNGAENLAYMAEYYLSHRGLNLDSGARAEIFIDENTEQIASIANGNSTNLDGNIVADFPIEDAVKIEVSTNAIKVTQTFMAKEAVEYSYQYQDVGESTYMLNHQSYGYALSVVTSANDIGLDKPEVLYRATFDFGEAYEYKIIPEDTSAELDGVADRYTFKFVVGEYFNADGILVDHEGNLINVDEHGYIWDWMTSEHIDDMVSKYQFLVPVNPLTPNNAINYYVNSIAYNHAFNVSQWVDDIGNLEASFTEEDLAKITADSTTYFDAVNTRPSNDELLENEDVFLDINAALSLEVILGEYEVNIALSGERTGFDDGSFDLDMSYSLPGEAAQRAFSVHANTQYADSFMADNAEGVVLLMNELEDDAETNVIGTIFVEGVETAQVEDRGGIITIVYSDETVETM